MMHTYPVLPPPGSITPFGLLRRIACGYGLNKWPFDGLIIKKLKAVSVVITTLVLLNNAAIAGCPKNLDFTKRFLASEQSVHLCQAYAGKVLLVVNTASYCGFTGQYRGLEALYQQYREAGLVVLGFPSNDFLQEPRSEDKVREFCSLTYNVKFPMFEKTRVAKRHADPFYRALADQSGDYPRWNFHKYLLDRQGNVVASYGSSVKPDDESLIATIESNL